MIVRTDFEAMRNCTKMPTNDFYGIFAEKIVTDTSSQHQRSPVNIIDPEYSISKYTLLVSLQKQIPVPWNEKVILRTFRRLQKTLTRFECICLNILRMYQTNYQQNSTNTIDRFTPWMTVFDSSKNFLSGDQKRLYLRNKMLSSLLGKG